MKNSRDIPIIDNTIKYHQVIEDSQSFGNLEQILSYAISKGDKYLAIAIQNTIQNGFQLIQPIKK